MIGGMIPIVGPLVEKSIENAPKTFSELAWKQGITTVSLKKNKLGKGGGVDMWQKKF